MTSASSKTSHDSSKSTSRATSRRPIEAIATTTFRTCSTCNQRDQEIYAHVAAASGLGRPGLLVAEQIEWAVKSAATVFQSEELEDDLAGVLGLAVDDEGGAKGICTIAALLLCNACLMHRRLNLPYVLGSWPGTLRGSEAQTKVSLGPGTGLARPPKTTTTTVPPPPAS